MKDYSFKTWLLDNIQPVLSKPVEPAPCILWCDPALEWKELLQKTCGSDIELWADDEHELLLRHRFAREECRPRVIWFPRTRADLTYFRESKGVTH